MVNSEHKDHSFLTLGEIGRINENRMFDEQTSQNTNLHARVWSFYSGHESMQSSLSIRNPGFKTPSIL